MTETEQQRRWWFATHPEYNWSRTGGHSSGRSKYEDEGSERLSPGAADAGADELLNYERDDFRIFLINDVKFRLKTEFQSNRLLKSALSFSRQRRTTMGMTRSRSPGGLAMGAFVNELMQDRRFVR